MRKEPEPQPMSKPSRNDMMQRCIEQMKLRMEVAEEARQQALEETERWRRGFEQSLKRAEVAKESPGKPSEGIRRHR